MSDNRIEQVGPPQDIKAIPIAAIGEAGITQDGRQVVVRLTALDGADWTIMLPAALAESLALILQARCLAAKYERGDASYKNLPLPEFEIEAPVLALAKDKRRVKIMAPYCDGLPFQATFPVEGLLPLLNSAGECLKRLDWKPVEPLPPAVPVVPT